MAMILEKSKLVVKSIGNPKKGAALEKETDRHFLGTIYGVATAVKTKVAPNGDTFEQIVGDFGGIPGEPMLDGDGNTIDEIRAGVLFLPGGMHDRLVSALKKADGNGIKFGVEVYTKKAANPIGYEYEFRPVLETTAADPLAEMRGQLNGRQKSLVSPDKPAGGKSK